MNETKPDAPARGFAEIRRARVFEAINGERRYQEMKWGDLVDHPQGVGAYLTLMRVHLTRAENAWAGANNDMEALDCLRKVLAIGVACGEQHGMPRRVDTAPTPPVVQGPQKEPQINLEGYSEAGSSLAGADGGSRAWSDDEHE